MFFQKHERKNAEMYAKMESITTGWKHVVVPTVKYVLDGDCISEEPGYTVQLTNLKVKREAACLTIPTTGNIRLTGK